MKLTVNPVVKKKETISASVTKGTNILTREFHFRKSFGDKQKEAFYTELQLLLSSGTDIRTAFEIIISEQTSEVQRKLLQDIYQSVLNGNSLSTAMKATGKFSAYEYYSLKIGEETGNINSVLKNLRFYFKKMIKLRRNLVSALTYPTLVIITAIVAVTFMLNFIVPMFEDIFMRFHGELPALTRFIINLSNSVSGNTGTFLFLLATFITTFLAMRKKIWFRERSAYLLLKIPVLGVLVKKIYLARFCQSMAMLISSKTPMISALELARKMIDFLPFERALEKIEQDVFKGTPLHICMEKFKIFDKRLIALTKVGEEVNQLDSIFTELSDQYSEEVEHQTSVLSSLLEPLLIIFVGGMVAIILIAMYLPLFQLSNSIVK